MQKDYSESTAEAFFSTYKDQPLSFILENSRMIFSEPFFGLNFYKESVLNSCAFLSIENELDKVSSFVEENADNMPKEQRELYEGFEKEMESFIESHKNTIIAARALNEDVRNLIYSNESGEDYIHAYKFEAALADVVHERNEEDINLITNLPDEVVEKAILIYAPYIAKSLGPASTNVMAEKMISSLEENGTSFTEDVDAFKRMAGRIVYANKLACDEAYKEATYSLNVAFRSLINFYEEATVDDLITEACTKIEKVVFHESAEDIIRNIFDEMEEDSIYKEEYDEEYNLHSSFIIEAYKETFAMLEVESAYIDDITTEAVGYTIEPNSSYEELLDKAVSLMDTEEYTEASDEDDDIDDDEIDELEKDTNDSDKSDGDSSKKASAPKPKNLANKIQFAAMDKEVKQRRKLSELQQKGQEVVNAAKASLQLPKNVIDSIKDVAKKFDEWDDERRKKYITEPGFRKKIFKNLKLSILYGTAAQTRLSLIPVTIAARHLSKQKNIRMRNELARELDTEIKVCDEKINDANANNDTKEKYRLMRIRDQLASERVRVRTNSRYI